MASTAPAAFRAVSVSPASSAEFPARTLSCTTASACGTPRSSSIASTKAEGRLCVSPASTPASATRNALSRKERMRPSAASASAQEDSERSRLDR
ncbi:Uncharacterised protein [Mycobacterium tuberculosis]|nr:Uncharacterised protein [Mycobacterium tuberculosis]